MSEQENGPSGDSPQTSGQTAQNSNQSDQSQDSRSLEDRIKAMESKNEQILSEKFKLKKELETLKQEDAQRKQNELKKNEEWQKYAEAKETEANELREKLTKRDTQVKQGQKLRSFLDAVQGEVQEEFWSLIDLEAIAIDPDTGTPEPTSVERQARLFEEKYSRVIDRAGGPKVPNTAAKQPTTTKITYDEWLNLPLKDQKARLPDVMKSEAGG